MSGVSHLIMQLSYITGVVSLILVLLPAFAPVLLANYIDAARSLIFGSTLFVCTIASYLICKDSGLALDCEGNEIVIGTPQLLTPLPSTETARTEYVNIRYIEEKTDPISRSRSA